MTPNVVKQASTLLTEETTGKRTEVLACRLPEQQARAFADLAERLETTSSDLLYRLVVRTLDGR